jgi:hypothetical protein
MMSIKLNAFTTSHLWLGLKASGDVGGKVDLLAEIVVNGQVLSSGTTRCLSTLTASASSPQDIATTFSAIPVTTVNPATQEVLAEVASGGEAEVAAAVAAAKAAFPRWAATPQAHKAGRPVRVTGLTPGEGRPCAGAPGIPRRPWGA